MGVGSFGLPDCDRHHHPPLVYAKISAFVSWIKERGSSFDEIYESEDKECGTYSRENSVVLPTAENVLAKVLSDPVGSAVDVILLAKSGIEGEMILKEILSGAADHNLVSELQPALELAAKAGDKVEDTLKPYVEANRAEIFTTGQ